MHARIAFLPLLAAAALASAGAAAPPAGVFGEFDPETDLLCLHYDHAPDKDDGQSAAADRTMLRSLFSTEWIAFNVVSVSGAYGINGKSFNPDSDLVMDAVWNSTGGWLAAHDYHTAVVLLLRARWRNTLLAGGDVWIKEGGQSDLTADVLAAVRASMPGLDTTERIHVVQHSLWNESHTTPAHLQYVKDYTDYTKIPDANAYLNILGGDEAFEAAALGHPVFGPFWAAAFNYYNPNIRLDFSDTGELMHILGFEPMGVDEFRVRFLSPNDMQTQPSVIRIRQ